MSNSEALNKGNMRQSEALKHFQEKYEVAARVDSDGVIEVQARDLRRLFDAPPDDERNDERLRKEVEKLETEYATKGRRAWNPECDVYCIVAASLRAALGAAK